MKKHAKKAAALLLALCMSVGVLAGCSNDGKNASNSPSSSPSNSASATPSGSPSPSADSEHPDWIVEKPITLKVLTVSDPGVTYSQDTPVFKEISKRTNINFEIEELPTGAEATTKLNLIMASKQLPDLLGNPGQSKAWFDKYGTEGALIDLVDLIKENAPDIQAQLDNPPYGDTRVNELMTGDKLYIVPIYSHPQPGAVYCIRTDWLKKLNMEVPTTVDELTAVLTAFKDKNVNGKGDVIPYSASSTGYVTPMVNFFGAHDGLYLDPDSNTIKFGPTDDSDWITAIKYIKDLYDKGLLDNEFVTADTASFEKKVSADRVGMFYGWPFSGMERQNELAKATNPDAEYTPIPPVKKDANSTPIKEGKQATQIIRSAITSSNKYPVETMKLLNYLYTKDGEELMNWGIEGEDFKKNSDGTREFLPSVTESAEGAAVYRGMRGMQRIFPFSCAEIGKAAEFFLASDRVKQAWTSYNESGCLAPLLPGVTFDDAQQARYNSLNTQVDTYLKEERAAFMVGNKDIDKEYENFKKELENRGVKEMLELWNAAYDKIK